MSNITHAEEEKKLSAKTEQFLGYLMRSGYLADPKIQDPKARAKKKEKNQKTYRLIWNEICDALIRTTRLSQNECSIEECGPQPVRKNRPIDQISHLELQMLIRKAKERASGVTAKGIECLELSVAGYKSREIGEMMNADASAVRMWMTKARRFLMVQPEIMDACEEVT